MKRCAWARSPVMIEYHDREWGVPVHDDRVLFEFITLEGAQAGLSWETILNKRDAYRQAFAGFDPARVARFTPARVERLLLNPGIVRNRLKVVSTVGSRWCPLGEAPARPAREPLGAHPQTRAAGHARHTTKTARHGLSGQQGGWHPP